MIRNKPLIVVASLFLLLSGCATVKLTAHGEKVRVLDPADVSSCRKLGRSSASVTAKALGVPRPAETIKKELESIARNSAADMGGDTIVALTVVSDGKQTFEVYKCVDPNN